jgi:plasmid stabilization system protein ParE
LRVVWSDRALNSLADIHARIASEASDEQANKVVDGILRRGDQLETFPASGRKVAHNNRPDIRELIEGPYRIVYRVGVSDVEVIEVFHGAQRPPWAR